MKKKNLFLKSTSSLLAMLFVVMSAFMFTACDQLTDDDEDPDPAAEDSIAEIIASSSDHTQLASYLEQYPDLINAISDTTASSTVFAPTDAAFATLEGTLDTDLGNVSPDVIAAVLAFHVHTGGAVVREDLTESTELATVQGESIKFNAEGNVSTGGSVDDVPYDGDEILATNGVVHSVSNILIPPVQVFSVVEAHLGRVSQALLLGADFTTLAAAINKADDYAEGAEMPTLKSILSNEESSLTVFAPVNQVFEQGGITLDSFTGEQWYGLISNHVLDQTVLAADLNGSFTSLAGGPIMASEAGLNSNGIDGPEATVAVGDAFVSQVNGVVHAIAGVLSPPTLVYAAVNLNPNFTTLKAAIAKADEFAEGAGQATLYSTLTDSEATLTVFAPVNDVFAAAGITLDDFTGEEWYALIANHVITSGAVASADLSGTYTSAAGSPITVLPSGGLDSDGESGAEATIAAPDAFIGSNGIVHGIAGILVFPPEIPSLAGTYTSEAVVCGGDGEGNCNPETTGIEIDTNVTLTDLGEGVYEVDDITFGLYPLGYGDDPVVGEMVVDAEGNITITDQLDQYDDPFNGSGQVNEDGTMDIFVFNTWGDEVQTTLTPAGSRISFKAINQNIPKLTKNK